MGKNFTHIQRLRRLIKFNYLKLLRSPGGAGKVSRGFAVGFGLEIILPYTLYTGYALLYPLVLLFRASLPTAIIGNLLCKVTFLPWILVPLGIKIGKYIPFSKPEHMSKVIYKYLKTLIGLSTSAIITGIISYLVMYFLYEANKTYRLKKRKEKNTLREL